MSFSDWRMIRPPNESSASMFCANVETSVDFVPTFSLGGGDDNHRVVTLLDGTSIGPWTAGSVVRIPLWLARYLQTKSLGNIVATTTTTTTTTNDEDETSNNSNNDNWMRMESLKRILDWEKSQETLWRNTETIILPERYWELSQCYSTADNAAAVSILLRDLWDTRLDKLRSQFQTLYQSQEPVEAANVTGIGSAELAVMKRVISRALTQKAALQKLALPPTSSQPLDLAKNRPGRTHGVRKFRQETSMEIADTTKTPDSL